jgi:hypothetical protein
MKMPTPTTKIAITALNAVTSGSYRTGASGTSKPSIAMKCISQIPNPIEMDAMTSQRNRRPPSLVARAWAAAPRPMSEPIQASR